MAKVTLILTDDFKDGQPVIKGNVLTDGVDQPSRPGAPVPFTPAQLYIEAVRRMWDDGLINVLLRRYVGDMLGHNDAIKKMASVAQQQKSLPAANDVEDAEIISVSPAVNNIDNAPPAADNNIGPTDMPGDDDNRS